MTREQAKQALKDGYKITHQYFTEDEYVGLFDGIICDENNIPRLMFWEHRVGSGWDEGWEIVE